MGDMTNMQSAITDVGLNTHEANMQEVTIRKEDQSQQQPTLEDLARQEAHTQSIDQLAQGNAMLSTHSQAEINNENINYMISTIDGYLSTINITTLDGLNTQQNLITSINSASKSISIIDQITLSNKLTTLSSAILHRTQQLMLNVSNVKVSPSIESHKNANVQIQQASGEYIKYRYLYQYMSNLDQHNLKETANELSDAASKQLKAYNSISVVPKVNRTQQPYMPYYQLFIGIPRMLHTLSKDQSKIILDRLNPNKISAIKEFPQFNPDFQFPCTVFCIPLEQQFTKWDNFTQVHKESQLSLPQNKDRSLKDIEGRFAFEQGCRWIQLVFDKLNMEWNERVAFIFVNGFSPHKIIQQNKLEPARVFCGRCQDTGVWDGQTTYIYNSTATRLGKTYEVLHDLSPILKEGSYKVNILRPKILPENISCIPPPKQYEYAMPLHNPWCNLVKSQLVEHLQKRFSPCVMYGGVYQPLYADSRYGVTGRMVSSIPRFHEIIPKEDYDKLFIWSIEIGSWQLKVSEEFMGKDIYLNYQLPSEQEQKDNFQSIRKYPHQYIDLIQPREYGSIHFWCWYNRSHPRNQITIDAMSINSQFSSGQNPFKPLLLNANYIDKLMLSNRDLNEQHTQTCYEIYIDEECQKNLEMALRYHRAQLIKGYNSPYLAYRELGQKTTQANRVPTILEFLTKQINQINLDPVRKLDTTGWAWIPKDLIPFYNEIDSICCSKKEIVALRVSQQRERDNQIQQQYAQGYIDSNKRYAMSPAKKKGRYQKRFN